MQDQEVTEVLIIGGSYAGLAAAMTLGRSLRRVVVIDAGKPCNRQTPHSHNFLTRDGETPAAIAAIGKEQVLHYPTLSWLDDTVTTVGKEELGFVATTATGQTITARKILFATGVADHMPAIEGFAESWGISVLHCPYCHGYEVSNSRLAVWGNGDMGFHLAMLIHHWSKTLRVFTDGEPAFSPEQLEKLKQHQIEIVPGALAALEHKAGYISAIKLQDGSSYEQDALFARVPFTQHCPIPETLGCTLNELGYLTVNEMKQTTVAGIYAAGDCTTMMRSVANAVAAGAMAGSAINKELIEEDF